MIAWTTSYSGKDDRRHMPGSCEVSCRRFRVHRRPRQLSVERIGVAGERQARGHWSETIRHLVWVSGTPAPTPGFPIFYTNICTKMSTLQICVTDKHYPIVVFGTIY